MSRHKYEIVINNDCKEVTGVYNYGSIKGITLSVGVQKAVIRYEIGRLRTTEDLIAFRYNDFRDALRKVILLHAVRYDRDLVIKKIVIKIDDEAHFFDRDHDPTGHFPYIFSMMGGIKLGLAESWKSLGEIIIGATKTRTVEDLRFSCMFSFLASRGRDYSIDRFLNLWTAMNAYYSYSAQQYEERVKKDHDIFDLSGKLKICGKDAESMGMVSWFIDEQYTDISDRNRLRDLWKNNYVIEIILQKYSITDIEKLYDAAEKELRGKALPSKYISLKNRAGEFGVKLFPFLLLIYPYNLRCRYFHGNSPTILIAAYNDYEISALETVNYFLTRFLNEKIPEMFSDDFWTDEKQKKAERYIEYLYKGQDFKLLVEKCKTNNTK